MQPIRCNTDKATHRSCRRIVQGRLLREAVQAGCLCCPAHLCAAQLLLLRLACTCACAQLAAATATSSQRSSDGKVVGTKGWQGSGSSQGLQLSRHITAQQAQLEILRPGAGVRLQEGSREWMQKCQRWGRGRRSA